MYKKGSLYMEDFFEEKFDFRELGANCNAVQAYINTDRTYLKYGWESTSGQRVEIFTQQNRCNIIVYKPNRNCLYELKSQVRSHNTNSTSEFSENYRYNSVRYCNSNTKVCFDFRKYNYNQDGIVGDYLLIYNQNEFDMNDAPPPPPAPPEEVGILEEEDEREELIVTMQDQESEVIEVIEEDEVEEIFEFVEQQPEFPGGAAEMYNYLGKEVKYPEMAREAGIQGKVYVKFVVKKDGSIGEVKVVRGVHKTLDREAIRAIKSMPKWTAGEQRGKKVSVWFTLPVNFRTG